MLSNLSNGQLIALGMILCIFLLYAGYKLYTFLLELFRPFKKGKSYWCRVIAVSDGDTLTCTRLNIRRSQTKLRFAYIDAPETKQSFGKESQQMVKKMVYRKLVRVEITDIDRYGRCVGFIRRYGKNINQELVKRGGAWVYEEYIRNPNQKQQWLALQQQAKKQKKGLWKNPNAMRPSRYRKQSK
ncbi:thermonuclease family protein [Acinetobacter tianfuensis]|uniref:Nuclease n=1 Tax=Acinetobacter tianfuensis TaxID=2419603 RepID=A0A3A8EFU0_9GAMM|nr:thermonuclease family protein [Acinetobacter tianfuensis]RKG33787.1 nuclease [Acinetobacter tianfuensis]